MQGIALQQQEFTKKIMAVIKKAPAELLELELKQSFDAFFIEVKQLEFELRERGQQPCHDCNHYKQQLVEECEKLLQQQDDSELILLKTQNQMLELQKSDLSVKMTELRAKMEELQKLRKEDKDNYRSQYESLKKKAQDKIHRLKDKNMLFQTEIQAIAVASMKRPSQLKSKLKAIILELHALKQQSQQILIDTSKEILAAKDSMILIQRRQSSGTIIRRITPEPSKVRSYFSQSQSIHNSPDRKLKTEKPRKMQVHRSTISKNLLAEFDASAQLTKYIKQFYHNDMRNSTGFHSKLL